MGPLHLQPWRQAIDVANTSLHREATTRLGQLRRFVDREPQVVSARVTWRIENVKVGTRNFRYRVTEFPDDGPDAAPRPWAINLHGYFAGGSMYARESERLATRFGWRVVNPSLPGFGGSDPLEWGEVSISALSEHVEIVRRELGITQCILLGHSMGGAVAIDFAARHPDYVLGVIYRDGVATPEWRERTGVATRVLGTVLPDVAPVVDLMAAVAMDVPDLLIGHLFTTIRALLPDLRSNVRVVAHSAPIGSMLMSIDLTDRVRQVAAAGIPIAGVWGCFDRVVTSNAAASFAQATNTDIQWVPGGHSWMLARPSGQADVLEFMPSGQEFLRQVERRRSDLGQHRHLRVAT